jgi:flagellar assembly factor FliW
MQVHTTRFGVLDIADDRVLEFPKGLLGFSQHTCFFWLQCVDEPSLAFVVTDPSLFVPEYSVPIRPEQLIELKLGRLEDAQVFVIVNKVDTTLTGNLQGPLVINTLTRSVEQLVLAEKRWTTRHPLMQVAGAEQTTRAASA